MISCDQFTSLISDYLDGFLSGERKKQFEEHLLRCESCKATFQRVKLLQKHLRALPRVHTSSTFEAVLHSRIRRELERESFLERLLLKLTGRRAPAYGLALASLAAVSILAFNLFFQTRPTGQATRPATSASSMAVLPANQAKTVAKAASTVEEHVRYILDEVALSETSATRTGLNSASLNAHRSAENQHKAVADSAAPATFPVMRLGQPVSVTF
jgi:anti-sigma factor RsiW